MIWFELIVGCLVKVVMQSRAITLYICPSWLLSLSSLMHGEIRDLRWCGSSGSLGTEVCSDFWGKSWVWHLGWSSLEAGSLQILHWYNMVESKKPSGQSYLTKGHVTTAYSLVVIYVNVDPPFSTWLLGSSHFCSQPKCHPTPTTEHVTTVTSSTVPRLCSLALKQFCPLVIMVMPSVIWLLVGHQEEHPACKNWLMRCWCGYLSGVRCRLFAYSPADVTVFQNPTSSCLI